MEEIKVYLDKEKKNEIKEDIEFEAVVAGEISKGKIYVENTTDQYMNVELILKGRNIEISKTISQIGPRETEEVEFKFTPKITTMKPITAKLKIKINYVIK